MVAQTAVSAMAAARLKVAEWVVEIEAVGMVVEGWAA